MWNLVIRVGTVLSTVLIGKQVLDRLWPSEIHPTRVYRPHQLARYMGTSPRQVVHLIEAGKLPARWVNGQPLVLGANVLSFLSGRD